MTATVSALPGGVAPANRGLVPVGSANGTCLGSRTAVALSKLGSENESPLGSSSVKQASRPASPGSAVTLDDFEVLDCDAGRSLGKGSFGVVRRIRRKGTDDVYALKTMQKIAVIEGDLIDQVEREIQVQWTLKHENILRLYKHFEDAETVYLLLEYCAKGELYQLLRTRRGRRFTEEVARHYFVQVTRGLRYLHSQSIVHRDLKPENLLVNADDVLKIADFGWCAVSSVTRTTFCGTLDYLAPEMIQGRGHNHTVDIWSLGVLLYEMVVGRPPFQSTNHVLLISKILSTELRFPPFVPHGVCDLVIRLLQKDPSDRMPLDQVLKHLWVIGNTNGIPSIPDWLQRETSSVPSPVSTEASVQQRLPQFQQAASRAGSVSNDGTPAQSQKLQPQASPRDGCIGPAVVLAGRSDEKQARCVSRPEKERQQASPAIVVPVAGCGPAGRVAPCANVAQPPGSRAQPLSTTSVPGCRAPTVQHAGTRLTPQLHAPQVARHNLSAPQTPVQQAPFRGIHNASIVSGRRCSGAGTAAVATAVPAIAADGRRTSRRESPGPTLSPVRRPRSSGPPEMQMPTCSATTVDLTNSSTSPSQGVGSSTVSPKTRAARPHSSPTLAGPIAPPTTAQQQRLAQTRVSAVGGYPMPGSPKPCTAGRSLSPVGPPTPTGTGASMPLASTYGHRSGAVARTISGIAIVRR